MCVYCSSPLRLFSDTAIGETLQRHSTKTFWASKNRALPQSLVWRVCPFPRNCSRASGIGFWRMQRTGTYSGYLLLCCTLKHTLERSHPSLLHHIRRLRHSFLSTRRVSIRKSASSDPFTCSASMTMPPHPSHPVLSLSLSPQPVLFLQFPLFSSRSRCSSSGRRPMHRRMHACRIQQLRRSCCQMTARLPRAHASVRWDRYCALLLRLQLPRRSRRPKTVLLRLGLDLAVALANRQIGAPVWSTALRRPAQRLRLTSCKSIALGRMA